MKIYLHFDSACFSKDQREKLCNKLFPVDFPVMPRKGEIIVCHRTLIKTLPLFIEKYYWVVDYVKYDKINNKYIPIVALVSQPIYYKNESN